MPGGRADRRREPGQAQLYSRAARCFEQAGFLTLAAECREAASLPAAAARLYEEVGDLVSAARCHRRAGHPADAVRCYLELGRPQEAAACWEDAGSLLDAAFVLAAHSTRTRHARWLVAESAEGTRPSPPLRRRIVLALCDARETRNAQALDRVTADVERDIGALEPQAERALVRDWAVVAADAVGRHDLAARAHAAAHRAGVPGSGDHWLRWAAARLGGTACVPVPAGMAVT
jgi:tetratricopeptide (TPR) repeat protein